ncbi:MAG: PEP-CTERM sorting domain-containing protein [Verrucomicrobiae bacterium]|nr:PEP-CTERM sorting domain-containing protein [Verrucomicrobiae bacterium]
MKTRWMQWIAWCAVLGAGPLQAQNLLTNGGFDTGDFTGWQGHHPNGWNFGQDGDANVWAVDGLNPDSGDFAAKNFFDGGIYQQVSVQGGQKYLVSGSTFVPHNGSGANWGTFVQLQWLNSSGQVLGTALDYNGSAQPLNQWDSFSQVFQAPNSAVSGLLKIGTYSNPGSTPANPTEFDSFSIAAVPEPEVISMMLAGGLLALVWRVRKRWTALAMLALLIGQVSRAEDPKAPQKLPFLIFGDKAEHFAPSGWMGDTSDLSFNPMWSQHPGQGNKCIQIKYSAKVGQGMKWAGIYWQDPANNWGTVKEGGFNLSAAKSLKFMARGEKGGETVEFKAGGISGEFPDTFKAEAPVASLTPEWKEYTIDLSGQDLSQVIGGFVFAVAKDKNPNGCTFYLDNIRYE